MIIPNTGELFFMRKDPNKVVVVTAYKGGTVFCEYINETADTGAYYYQFCRTLTDFTNLFKKIDDSWHEVVEIWA